MESLNNAELRKEAWRDRQKKFDDDFQVNDARTIFQKLFSVFFGDAAEELTDLHMYKVHRKEGLQIGALKFQKSKWQTLRDLEGIDVESLISRIRLKYNPEFVQLAKLHIDLVTEGLEIDGPIETKE